MRAHSGLPPVIALILVSFSSLCLLCAKSLGTAAAEICSKCVKYLSCMFLCACLLDTSPDSTVELCDRFCTRITPMQSRLAHESGNGVLHFLALTALSHKCFCTRVQPTNSCFFWTQFFHGDLHFWHKFVHTSFQWEYNFALMSAQGMQSLDTFLR